MKKRFLNTYLERLYEDRNSFIEVFGTKKLLDPKFMLIADVLSEHQELFSDAILERINAAQEQQLATQNYFYSSIGSSN